MGVGVRKGGDGRNSYIPYSLTSSWVGGWVGGEGGSKELRHIHTGHTSEIIRSHITV